MYKTFTVKNYRCFDSLAVQPLERVNLIGGKNNVGKTALLEALWLHKGYYNPELEVRVGSFRGISQIQVAEFLWDLFNQFDPAKVIELLSTDREDLQRVLRISVQEQPILRVPISAEEPEEGNGHEVLAGVTIDQETTLSARTEILLDYTDSRGGECEALLRAEGNTIELVKPPATSGEPQGIFFAARRPMNHEGTARRLSKLAVVRKQRDIVQVMNIVEPRLKSLSVQIEGDRPMVYGELDGIERLLPVPLMGDGMGRLLEIAVAIPETQNGVLLIDEIENGLHYSVMSEIWQAIATWAREYNVQIFATTHSWECIKAAHKAFEAGENYDFCYHRLDRVDEHIEVVSYDQETLSTAVEMDLEVR